MNDDSGKPEPRFSREIGAVGRFHNNRELLTGQMPILAPQDRGHSRVRCPSLITGKSLVFDGPLLRVMPPNAAHDQAMGISWFSDRPGSALQKCSTHQLYARRRVRRYSPNGLCRNSQPGDPGVAVSTISSINMQLAGISNTQMLRWPSFAALLRCFPATRRHPRNDSSQSREPVEAPESRHAHH